MKPNTVLLVDDIPDYLDTMEVNLPDACRVLRAESAEDARKLVEAERPALAVIDVRLVEDEDHNRDGLELLNWLHERYPGVVVIMISAYREFEYAAESLAMGAEYFLRKPIQPDEFRQAVQRALGKQE